MVVFGADSVQCGHFFFWRDRSAAVKDAGGQCREWGQADVCDLRGAVWRFSCVDAGAEECLSASGVFYSDTGGYEPEAAYPASDFK